MQAIDTMEPGDVLVVDAGHNRQSALWGELLSTACMAKGVRGIVMSTCTRDLWALNQMDFAVFGIGCTPADSKGRIDIVEIGMPITIDGVWAKNGDLIFGDEDGVVIVPTDVADEPWKETGGSDPTVYVPLQAREGDTAVFLRSAAVEITVDSRSFLIVPNAAVLVLQRYG